MSKKIPTQNTMPIDYTKNKAIYSMYLAPVSETEIKKLISSLKSNTPGYDMIGSAVLKWCVDSISEPLSYVRNISLQEGLFPDELKIANVIPLYKCDDPKLFNNCRPVSVLPSVSKVFEGIMYNRLVAYLNEYKILFSYQFGFRKQHSTYMALMTLMDKLTKCLDNDEYVIGVFLDFSKAFDTLDHTILLQKLSVYGIRGNALSWFESYLKDRRQFVTYNGVWSETKILQCGVPQSSILGPLLFLIYINDLANVCTSSFPILFADDTNLFNHGKDMFSLQATLNQELANISQWLKVNKLSLNIKKTMYMVFTRKKTQSADIKIEIDNEIISETKSSKFLGVHIDNKLNWKMHVDYVSGKIARGIGILVKDRKVFSNECMINLYYAFIYPYLIYCNHIWGNTYKTTLSKLQLLQNKAIRIITGSPPRTNNETLYKHNCMLNLNKINTYLVGKFMYDVYNCIVPDMFTDMFVYNNMIHDHDTRISGHLHPPTTSSNSSRNSIRYHGVIIWNKILTAAINPDSSEVSFKIMLKKRILQEVITHTYWTEHCYYN